MFLALFQSFCNYEISIKLNLPILLVLVRQREKSQKYFDLPGNFFLAHPVVETNLNNKKFSRKVSNNADESPHSPLPLPPPGSFMAQLASGFSILVGLPVT